MLFGFFLQLLVVLLKIALNIADHIYAKLKARESILQGILFPYNFLAAILFDNIFLCSLSVCPLCSSHMLRVLPAKCAWEPKQLRGTPNL